MSNPTYFETNRRFDKIDLQACVEQYQISENENLLSIILYKLSRTMNYIAYQKTKYPDKAEIFALCEDILLKCLKNYDSSYGVKFITFYTTSVFNALKTLHKKVYSQTTLSLDYEYDNQETENNTLAYFVGHEETGYDEVETKVLLDQLKKTLIKSKQRVEGQWEREYKVCEMILTEPHKLTYAEIAKELHVTASAVPLILERIKKKCFAGDGTNISFK